MLSPYATDAHPSDQRGVSLVELMVGMTVALLVTVMIGGSFLAATRTGGTMSAQLDVQYQLRRTVDIVAAELRRAGYDSQATFTINRFTRRTAPATDIFAHKNNSCVLFAYDNTMTTTAGDNFFGFRLNNNTVQMLLEQSNLDTANDGTCDNHSAWMSLTDPRTVRVTDFTVTLGYQCVPLGPQSTTQTAAEQNTPCTGTNLREVRTAYIVLTGQSVRQSDLPSTTARTSVRLPNDRIL